MKFLFFRTVKPPTSIGLPPFQEPVSQTKEIISKGCYIACRDDCITVFNTGMQESCSFELLMDPYNFRWLVKRGIFEPNHCGMNYPKIV